MKVTINGREEIVDPGSTLGDFLRRKEIDFNSVVVEMNGEILKKEDYTECVIREKDIIEILRFVGGG